MNRYKKNKLETTQASYIKNYFFVFFGGGNTSLVSRKNPTKTIAYSKFTAPIFNFFASNSFKWGIAYSVLISINGKNSITEQSIQANVRYKQSELSSFLHEKHVKIIKDSNPKYRANIGWIACPDGHLFTEHEQLEIFEGVGAYDMYEVGKVLLDSERVNAGLISKDDLDLMNLLKSV